MNRGTRRLAWLAAVFALAAVPVACSGFSSEETQASPADGGDAASSVGDDSAVVHDTGLVSDDAVADAASFCSAAHLFCTDFESRDAGAWSFAESVVLDGGTLEERSEVGNSVLFVQGGASRTYVETSKMPGLKFQVQFDAKFDKAALAGNGSMFASVRMYISSSIVNANLYVLGPQVVVEYSGTSLSSTMDVGIVGDRWAQFVIQVDLSSANPVSGTVTLDSGGPKIFAGKPGAAPSAPTGISLDLEHWPSSGAGGAVSFDNVRIDAL